MQPSRNRLKLIQYSEDNIGPTGVLFLQETHFDSKVKQKWKEDFKDPFFTMQSQILVLS